MIILFSNLYTNPAKMALLVFVFQLYLSVTSRCFHAAQISFSHHFGLPLRVTTISTGLILLRFHRDLNSSFLSLDLLTSRVFRSSRTFSWITIELRVNLLLTQYRRFVLRLYADLFL